MHLEAVHNVQQNVDRLLEWSLSEQSVGVGSGDTTVTNNLKGRSSKSLVESLSKSNHPVPGSLLQMKGISVHRVDGLGRKISFSTRSVNSNKHYIQHKTNNNQKCSINSADSKEQEEHAINRWANGCEHSCRICKKNSKHFTSFTKQNLLKHLKAVHEISERDYKDEFKCSNLVTRTNSINCKECKAKVKRLPTSLSMHFKKHGLNIRTYWQKHIKPSSVLLSLPLTSRGSHLKGRGGVSGKIPESKIYKCTSPDCARSFDNTTALNHHRSWHVRKDKGIGQGLGSMQMQPVVLLNKVVKDEISASYKDKEEVVVETDPLDMLEVDLNDEVESDGEDIELCTTPADVSTIVEEN